MPCPDAKITQLLTDSRRLNNPAGVLFFAIPTRKNSGTRYIDDLYHAGVRNFVVPTSYDKKPAGANVWRVDDVVSALQSVAQAHRQRFHIPVIGITGSNGKTIVKDWLVQMLAPSKRVVASPKSYNSQIGVPLSVWQISETDEVAIFEAGISREGEMAALQRVIRPTIGILTNIGSAHDEGFASRRRKIEEKLLLFTECEVLLYCGDDKEVTEVLRSDSRFQHIPTRTWGEGCDCNLRLLNKEVCGEQTHLTIALNTHDSHLPSSYTITIPFAHDVAVRNALTCLLLLAYLGYREDYQIAACRSLTEVETRMQLVDGVENSMIINDTYSLDLNSLDIALDYLQRQHYHEKRTLVVSDLLQSGQPENTLYANVAAMVRRHGVTRLVGVGEALCRQATLFEDIPAEFFPTTEDFLQRVDPESFAHQTVLLKGARLFGFERIAERLRRHSHETVLEVNLDALVHNMNYYRTFLRPTTRLMAMVKASGYGAGTVEVAAALQQAGADYLTVAYADEGVALRRGGITLPIMVMNPEPAAFDDIVRHRLEPDLYSFRILHLFADYVQHCGEHDYPVHIEFDTGMHRLGFGQADSQRLLSEVEMLRGVLQVQSVFSHLACSEDPTEDDFTRLQIERLQQWSVGLPGMRHILNSSGIARFAESQMDMVRLGLGLYGVAPQEELQQGLRTVSRLVSRISQIKDIPQGESVGYNRRWVATRPSRIAILTIGYADGLHRGLGNGHGHVCIGSHEAPIIGSVCMDMCFVDVTDIPCREGDEAVLFGEADLLQRNAEAAGTIPYELLTAVAPRVKRVYYYEG